MPERADRLLLLAVAAGLGLGLWQALGLPVAPADGDAAAVVDGEPISRAEWQRALEAIARDKRSALTEADRLRALDNLINETLLVQQAERIGLLQSDRAVRKAIVDSMLQFIIAGAQSRAPNEEELRDLYLANPAFGREDEQLQIAHVQAREWSADRLQRLRNGEPFNELFAAELQASAVPTGWLLRSALDTYLPPRLIRELDALQPGDIAGPYPLDGQQHLLWLQARRAASRPDFAALRPQLAQLWQRQASERAVADALRQWRQAADIELLAIAAD